jgi:SAM-dependent methyltransferase
MTDTQKTGFHTVKMGHEYPIEPLEYVPCPLCTANDDHVLATKGFPNEIPVRNVICKGCGMIRIDPRMTRENYELFYKEDFFGYLNPFERPAYVEEIEHTRDENYMTPTKKKVLPHVLPYVKEGGKVLDVGAGLGQIIYLLQKEKHVTAIGLEPDPFSRKIAKEKMGVELTDMIVENFLETNTEMFDFIFMDQTFEHLLSPLETIQGLAKCLSPEGVMYIGVPGAYNPTIHMKLFYQIAHTYNYTPHTMNLFAEKAGLKIINITDAEVYPLIALMAHKEASYPEVAKERVTAGSDWKDVVARHARKRFLNKLRGSVKQILIAVGGKSFKERVKLLVDRIVRYRY